MRKTILLLILALIILGGAYYIASDFSAKDPQEKNGQEVPPEVQAYFNERLRARVVETMGQPIEGFEPFMFLKAWNGLTEEDFENADALLGKYMMISGGLVFVEDKTNPVHSAAAAISDEGMQTLLANIIRRTGATITTVADIEALILSLDETSNQVFTCTTEQRDADICIQIFEPVCGKVNIQCITTPCEPIRETFPNSCFACANPLMETYTKGACPEEGSVLWKAFIDDTNGISFHYPESLPSKYISTVDWPPQIAILDEPFTCTEAGSEMARAGRTEKHVVGDQTYCVTKESEGAAGSIYTNYAYAAQVGSEVMIFTFSLRAVQCGNYDKLQKSECEIAQESFDLDSIMHRLIQSIKYIQ